MNIKITADSTCDLSRQQIADNRIHIVPLSVNKADRSYKDGVNITPADIFAHVDAGGALCTTAAVNIGEYDAVFQAYAADYDAVVHITISSEFSACYQNACIAAQNYANVFVVDSRNLSTGHGLVVMEACRLAKTCESPEALCQALRELTGRIEASFLLNRLDYMVKGGRCSSVMALGANLLHLKPCIEVIDGRMQVVKKYRGSFDKCLAAYVKERLDGRQDVLDPSLLFITHTPVEDTAMAAVRAAVTEFGRFHEVVETEAGCTVTCHCGPGTLGILFIRKK